MDETVHATEVHEHTVVGDVLDHAFENLTLLQTGDEVCPLEFLLCLEESLVGNNHVLEFLIDLDNLEIHCSVYEHIVVTDGLDVDLGTGKEGLDTEYVHDHTALCAGLYITLNDLTAFICGIDHIPGFELAGLAVGDDKLSLAVFCRLDENLYLVAYLEVRIVTELGCGDDTFALCADVDNNFALVDGGNDTFNNLIFSDLGEGLLVLGDGFIPLGCIYAFILKGFPVKILGCY